MVERRHDIQPYDIQHNDIQHIDPQHNDIQPNDIQHNDIQSNDIQHKGLIYGTQYTRQSAQKTQHNNMSLLSAIILNVAFSLLLF